MTISNMFYLKDNDQDDGKTGYVEPELFTYDIFSATVPLSV